jgi:hypothetical protein
MSERPIAADIVDLIAYFQSAKNGIPQSVQEKIHDALIALTPDICRRAIDWMYENLPRNFGLDMNKFYQAIREAKGYDSPYVKTESWKCEVCGYDFQFHPNPSDDDMFFKGIFDRCPRCMFYVQDSKDANVRIQKWGGEKAKAYYQRMIDEHLNRWEKRGGAWWYNKKEERAWREARDKKDKEQNTENIRNSIAETQKLNERVNKILERNRLHTINQNKNGE